MPRKNLWKSEMVFSDVDSVDKSPNSCRVKIVDLGALVYAIILHFADVGFDIFLAYSYFSTQQYSYFAWTASFIAVPAIIMSAISIRMYIDDSENNLNSWKVWFRPILCVVGLPLQIAPIIRYTDSLKYAIKCFRAESNRDKRLQQIYYKKMLKEDSDTILLRVFECYIESTFQQVLQLTILLIDYLQGLKLHLIKQCIMITLSFVSMGWCMATYNRYIRFDQDDKLNISKLGTVVQFFWHLNFTVSRILALVATCVLYPFWASIAIAVHWCLMTTWIAVMPKIHFCGKSFIWEVFFSSAVGLIYIFNFISLKDGPTAKFYYIFFSICGIENLVASVLWGIKAQSIIESWIFYIFLILPVLTFVLSILFLIIYYSILHPNKTLGGK